MTESLAHLGAEFTALMTDYRAAQSQLSALQHEADRTAADAGLVYGSSAWSEHRFAVTGRTVHHLNALHENLEGVAQEIEPISPVCFADLLIKARAHHFTGNSVAIITEIEALAEANIGEAHPVCRPGTATCGNQRRRYDVLNSTLPGSPVRQNRSTRPKEDQMNANAANSNGASEASVAIHLAALANLHLAASSSGGHIEVNSLDSHINAGLLRAIEECENAYQAWDNTVPRNEDLPTGTAEHRAYNAAEARLLAFPCKSYADVLAKTRYLHHAETEAALTIRHSSGIETCLEFVASLLGIGAGDDSYGDVEPVPDRLLEAIKAYREGLIQFNRLAAEDDDDVRWSEYGAMTYEPWQEKLDNWSEPARTREGAIEALRAALEENDGVYGTPAADSMVRSVLGYLEGGEAAATARPPTDTIKL